MPVYEYICSRCDFRFELKRPFAEASEKAPCPHCHQEAKRVISSFFPSSKDEFGENIPLARPWRYVR